jgi:hypothetical protein
MAMVLNAIIFLMSWLYYYYYVNIHPVVIIIFN